MEQCPSCPREFGSPSALTNHINKEHPKDPLALIAKAYGEFAPRPGGAWRPDRPLRAAPSGVPSVDYAIGIGGLPRGCIIEVFGPPSSGKTTMALTFSAYAQKNGGLCGYEDAEHRFQASMAKLSGIDLDALYFSEPKGGEQALNQAKDYIQTGIFDIWTIDSVHGCVPAALMDNPIGKATMSELAKLMSVGCQVLDSIVSETNTVLIFVNHIKDKPGVIYGKDWSKPGGSALDYYASVQLKVTPVAIFQDAKHRKLGHTVKIRVENSKVAAPFAEATYDLFLAHGKIKKSNDEHDGMVVNPGIDIGSSWFSVCRELKLIKPAGNKWADADNGELLGTKREVTEMLEVEEFYLRKQADDFVYGAYARNDEEEEANELEEVA